MGWDHANPATGRNRSPAPARASGQRGATGPVAAPGALLALQRSAGNRAVARMVDGAPALQRFVGTEHKQLGDSTSRMVDLGNGVVLSWGDLVALAGDEYRTLDALLADTRDEAGKQRLLAAIRDDHIPDPTSVTLPEPTQEQTAQRFLAFVALAAENSEHFNADSQSVRRWQADHAVAVSAALDAGLSGEPGAWQLAQAREAFAQHFLTDAFSGGHIRTPRPDIIGWYRANFGAPVVDEFIRRMSARLIDGIVQQISPQTSWPDFIVRRKVSKAVGERLAAAIASIPGGRAKLNDYFALAVAGVVSGAMHDLEGRRGVAVASDAHPEPWTAFGDARLGDSPVSHAQAELAIAAATRHLDVAREVGRRHAATADRAHAPQTIYFGFDSAGLKPTAAAQLTPVIGHLHGHPEVRVTLTGHTDPTGSDAYNDELGRRRAEAVAAQLAAGGVNRDQVTVSSQGERALVTPVPAQFRVNRRVTFEYESRPGPYRDVTRAEAVAELASAIVPPYADVTRFVPYPLPAATTSSGSGQSTTATSQVELENWRWGQIPATLRGEINTWVGGYGRRLTDGVASAEDLRDDVVEGYTIRPRPLVTAIARDLLSDPATFLEEAVGRPMSP